MANPVLVTGAEGFIGKHVTKRLDASDIPYETLDRAGHPTYKVDITGGLDWLTQEFSRVIHLAGVLGTHELFDSAREAIDVNIHGTLSVLELCRRQQIPFTGITMDHVWVNPYETTKLAAERLAEAWGREFDFLVNYITVYNAYGEHQAHGEGHPQKIIPTFATKAWNKEPLPVWGDGSQLVDLVYAGDVADLLITNSTLDGGYGREKSVLDVARMVWEMVNPNDPLLVEFLPMRRGEHLPKRDPIARNPLLPEDYIYPRLRETIEWYKPEELAKAA